VTPPKSASEARPAVVRGPREPMSPVLVALIPALAALVLYLPALRYGWVWDDGTLAVSHATRSALSQGFHPAVGVLYRLEWLAGIGNPSFYHLTSVLLHAVATWLFYLLIRGTGAGGAIAMGASLLFAAHPIHTEAVAYVTGRADLLATACALGALVLARSAPVCAPDGCRSWRVWPAYALLAIAVLSDEVALVTPLLLIGLDRWGSPRVSERGRRTVYWGFTAVAVAGLLARIGAHALRLNEPHDQVAAGTALWAPLIAAGEYLRALLAPYPLNAMRSLTTADAASWALRLQALGALALIALFVWVRRKDPLARTGALLLFLPLLPALPIGPFQGTFVEERAAYFASAGFVFLVASLVAWIAGRSRETRIAAAAVMAAIVLGAGALTMSRLPVWSSNVALLDDAVRHDPRDPAAHVALADQYIAEGNYHAALASLDRAIAVDSTRALAWHRRTLLLNRMGKLPEAEASGRHAVAIQPSEAIFWANLGDILTREGKTHDANAANGRAVALDPKNPDNWYNYGVSLAASDSLPQAMQAYRRAIALNPGHFQAVNNLGAALAISGRIPEARDVYLKAVELEPSSVQARMNLALAYLRLGDIAGASAQREAVQKLDPAAAMQLVEMIKQVQSGKR